MTPEACKTAALNAVDGLKGRAAYVDERSSLTIGDNLTALLNVKNVKTENEVFEENNSLCINYGFGGSSREKPFAFNAGTAIIPVHGSLINRLGGYYGYVTGYQFIRKQFAMAMADEDVKNIVLDVNSGGGQAAGCMELSTEIYNARGDKPILAVIDSSCYSAAYAIASAADRIAVTPSGGAGSIGALILHVDVSNMLQNVGIKVSVIRAGDRKAEGNPFEELSEDAKKTMQNEVNECRKTFVETVARNRNLSTKLLYDTEARCYNATDAKELGLVDEVATPSEAIQSLLSVSTGGQTIKAEKESKMEKPENQTPSNDANAQAQATATERSRIKGIMGCEEAKGREALANYIAFDTNMSEEEAKKMLAQAPVAQAPVAPAPAAPTKAEQTAFEKAMGNSTQPEVGADSARDVENHEEENPLMAGLKSAGYKLDN